MKFDRVVSLGTCCATSFIIQRLFPGQLNSPFDWLSINNADCVSKVLKEDFMDFTVENLESLPWRPWESGFHLCASRYPTPNSDNNSIFQTVNRFEKNEKI